VQINKDVQKGACESEWVAVRVKAGEARNGGVRDGLRLSCSNFPAWH